MFEMLSPFSVDLTLNAYPIHYCTKECLFQQRLSSLEVLLKWKFLNWGYAAVRAISCWDTSSFAV